MNRIVAHSANKEQIQGNENEKIKKIEKCSRNKSQKGDMDIKEVELYFEDLP